MATKHSIRVNWDDGKRSLSVDQETVTIVKGDTVSWNGPVAFDIEFDGASPWTDTKINYATAVRGRAITTTGAFKYSVKYGDAVLDPIIIVEEPKTTPSGG